ncbi:protein of unknown function [Pseudodesulfovibrio piezophilus C1TLV30]|uniref:Uncharacterized protein n=1 Tax=Pseudodesulfovibrio piezophilus (strain DSM 21447 / JCM 15486 / C1TLV30) TaxID=1322246 RepID=M1WN86_PSEP2|nr:protein of unknown function [Pseudodesulfovibrio piezophilus C1TLV30]
MSNDRVGVLTGKVLNHDSVYVKLVCVTDDIRWMSQMIREVWANCFEVVLTDCEADGPPVLVAQTFRKRKCPESEDTQSGVIDRVSIIVRLVAGELWESSYIMI